jgi:uncharacterized repeat protein (TIGR03806 family)
MKAAYFLTLACAVIVGLVGCGGSGSDSSNRLTLSITDIDVLEGDSATTDLMVRVELNGFATESVSFNYVTVDGDAESGLDYIAQNASATIASGQSFAHLSIPIIGDTIVELDKSFKINLNSITNAVAGQIVANVTVRDNDESTVPALLTRPQNTSCDIPDPPFSSIKLTRVFSALSFDAPILILQAPGNNDRWYVVEQDGLSKTFNTSDSSTTIFADLTDRAIYNGGQDERGLLGMAFHPDFQANGQVYLSYVTDIGSLRTIVSRYVSADNGLTINKPAFNVEDIVLDVSQPANNHNGGNITFGADGLLYIGLGDGGGSNDTFLNGLDTQTLLGSMLRIDVDGSPALGKNYAIPAANPFVGDAQVLDEIYAYGLRNPWRWSFDRQTGDLYLGDVGQSAREEVDFIEAGQHYGWGCFEGSLSNASYSGSCSGIVNNPPIHEYPRSDGTTVVGGYVYRGSNIGLTGFVGSYLFADFGVGTIWRVDPGATNVTASLEVLLNTGRQISSFGEDNLGELYVLSWSDGQIFRIDPGSTSSFPNLLSQTGCVDPANPSVTDSSMIPYRINAEFWSDGAIKERWFALQDGTLIDIETDGDWTFPIGSVLLKHFHLNDQLVETRLLVHHQDNSWGGYSYEWNDTGTDATVRLNGKSKTIDGQEYIYPSSSQCAACHTNAAGNTLGPETAQMNRKQRYSANGNAVGNQITALDNIGMFTSSPGSVAGLPKIDDPHNTLVSDNNRVRAYWHTNCAQCHRPGNIIQNADIDFRFNIDWNNINICNHAPAAGDLGVPGAQRLSPGAAAESLVYLRMSRRDGEAMPPLGSTLIDDKAATLLENWINNLSQCPN